MPHKISVVENLLDLAQLRPAWEVYAGQQQRDAQYFHTLEWATRNWKAAERRGARPFAVVAADQESTILIWALQLDGRPGLRSIRALALDRPYYNDAMIWPNQPGRLIEDVWNLVEHKYRPDYAWFDMVRPEANVARLLEGHGARHVTIPSPYIRTSAFDDYDSFHRQLRRGLRKDQRRRRRRLSEQGRIRFEAVHDYKQASSSIDWIIDQKIAWLRHVGGKRKALTTATFSDFVHEVCLDAALNDRLFIGQLLLDGQPIAAEAGFIFEQTLSSWIASFDHNYGQFAPGRILMEECIKWSWSNGIELYDLLPSDDPYKREWGEVRTVNSYILPTSTRGRIYTDWRMGRVRAWIRQNFGVNARRQWKLNKR